MWSTQLELNLELFTMYRLLHIWLSQICILLDELTQSLLIASDLRSPSSCLHFTRLSTFDAASQHHLWRWGLLWNYPACLRLDLASAYSQCILSTSLAFEEKDLLQQRAVAVGDKHC